MNTRCTFLKQPATGQFVHCEKPATVVVTYSPGGLVDAYSREFCDEHAADQHDPEQGRRHSPSPSNWLHRYPALS